MCYPGENRITCTAEWRNLLVRPDNLRNTESTDLEDDAMGRALGVVGACIVLSGLLVQAYLAVVAHHLSTVDYSSFGSFWSIALVVGFGVFLPVEQELARLGPVALRPAARVALGLAAAEVLVVLAAAVPLRRALGGQTGALVAVAALCLVSAGQFLVRGGLVGQQRMASYGGLLVLDTALRVLFAFAVAALFAPGVAGYTWTLVAAIALAHLPVLLRLRRAPTGPAPETPDTRAFARAVLPLLLGSLAAQLLLNGLPVLVSLVATDTERDAAGRFLAAFLLARVPLFVAVPLQTTLVPALTAVFQGGRRALITALTRLAALVGGIGVLGVAVALTAGPWLVRLVFGAAYRIDTADLVLITLGVTAHLGLIITTQALVAAGLHSRVAWSWLTGIAVAALAFALIPGLLARAEWAFLLGSGLGWAAGIALLATAPTTHDRRATSARQPG
jgi:O-antigen/teichoic acid export membrane protein